MILAAAFVRRECPVISAEKVSTKQTGGNQIYGLICRQLYSYISPEIFISGLILLQMREWR